MSKDIRVAMTEMYLQEGNLDLAAQFIGAQLKRDLSEGEFGAFLASLLDRTHPIYHLDMQGGKRGKRHRPEWAKMQLEVFDLIEIDGLKQDAAFREMEERYGFSRSQVYKAYKEILKIRTAVAEADYEEQNSSDI